MAKNAKKNIKRRVILSFFGMFFSLALCVTMAFAWFTVEYQPRLRDITGGTGSDIPNGIMDVYDVNGVNAGRYIYLDMDPGMYVLYRLELYSRAKQQNVKFQIEAGLFEFAYPETYTTEQREAGPYYYQNTENKYMGDISSEQFLPFVSPVSNTIAYKGFFLEEGETLEEKLVEEKEEMRNGVATYITDKIEKDADPAQFVLENIDGNSEGISLNPGKDNMKVYYLLLYFDPSYVSVANIVTGNVDGEDVYSNIELKNSNPFAKQSIRFRIILEEMM